MSGSAADEPVEIPPEVEDQVLEILDETEPGTKRDAALDRLGLDAALRAQVDAWLATEADSGTFLASATTAANHAVSNEPSGETSKRLGDYELEQVLGKGGMGVVYRARDLRLGRTVALKVLPDRFSDNPKRLQRFEREIRAVAALQHPSIVPVYVAGQIDDVPFYTMELVHGRSLDKVIAALKGRDNKDSQVQLRDWHAALGAMHEGSTTSERVTRTYLEAVCRTAINIAEALQHAHDNGVIHRDVKPSNVIAESSGRARLFDFGLAQLDDELQVTRSSELLGSPHYMSPEQVSSAPVDHRTDIYSLGVTLYELLTLHVPFEVQSPQQVFQMIVHREPRRPGLLNPILPKDVETICLKAMEKDPDRRYATAADLAEDLRRFLRFEPILARPIGAVTRGTRWLRRNRMASALVLLVIVALAVIWYQGREGKKEVEQVTTQLEQVKRDLESLKTKRDEAQKRLQELQTTAANKSTELDAKQAELQGVEQKLRTREAEIAKQRQEQQKLAAKNTALDKQTKELQRDATTQQARLGKMQRDLDQLGTERTRLQQEIAAGKKSLQDTEADLSRAKADLGSLRESHRVTNINKLVMEATALRATDPALGLLLAEQSAALADQEPRIADAALRARIDDTLLAALLACNVQGIYHRHSQPVTAIAFAPDGSRVASATVQGAIHVWDATSRHTRARAKVRTGVVHLEFATANWLLIGCENGEVFGWDAAGNSAPLGLKNARHQTRVRQHLSPNREFIVNHVDRRPSQLLVHKRGEEQPERNLGTVDAPIVDFEFGPHSNLVAATTTTRMLQLWDLRTGALQREIESPNSLLAATFDVQGQRLATLDAIGVVRIFNVADGDELARASIHDNRPLGNGRLAFCANDRHLFVSANGISSYVLLDAADGRRLATIDARGANANFTLDPRRAVVCIGQESGAFVLFNAHNAQRIATLNGTRDGAARARRPVVAFEPSSAFIATALGRAEVRVFWTRPGGVLPTVGPGLGGDPIDGSAESLRFGHFESGGRITTASNLGVSTWHVQTGVRRLIDHDARRPLPRAAIGRRGGGVVYADGRAQALLAGPRPIVRELFRTPPHEVDQVLTWPGGRFGAVHSDETTRRLRLLDNQGRQTLQITLPAGRPGAGTPQPAPDGRRFLIGYDDLSVIDLETPTRRTRLPFSRRPAVFSASGTRVAASTGFGVKVFESRSGATWCDLPDLPDDYSQLTALAFLDGDARVVTGWSDGQLRFHDVRTRRARLLATVRAHRGAIRSIELHPSRPLLVTASADGTAKVFDHTSPDHPPLTFAPGQPCEHASFEPGGNRVLVVAPRSAHVFPLDLRAMARAARPRDLTAAEREEYGLQR